MVDIEFEHRAERTPTAGEPNPPGEYRGVVHIPDQYHPRVQVRGVWCDSVDDAMADLWEAMGEVIQHQAVSGERIVTWLADGAGPLVVPPSMPTLKSHTSDEVFAALRGLGS